MSTRTFKSAKLRKAVKGAIGTTVAVPLLFAALPVAAQGQIGNTTFEVDGYVKLDAWYDREADFGVSLLPSDIISADGLKYPGHPSYLNPATGSQDHDGNFGTTAKQTRIRINTLTPTEVGDIKGYLEFDMYGASGSQDGNVRNRLAYFQWENWTFGRAWSNFVNFNYGTTLNFAGPAGQTFARSEQVRYDANLANGGTFGVALERNQDNYTVHGGGGNENTSLPALTLSYTQPVGNSSFDVRGIVRQIEGETAGGHEDSALAWGVNAGTSVTLPNDTTTLMLTAAYGEGMGTYIYNPTMGGTGAYFDGDSLKRDKRWGAIGTISQKFTDQVTGNIVYGYSNGKFGINEEEIRGQSLGVNMLYSPVDQLVFGAEYTRVWVKDKDGYLTGYDRADGHANRVQFSAIYNF